MTPLRQRMTEDMQVRGLSPCKQATYILRVSLFARHFHRSPEALDPDETRLNHHGGLAKTRHPHDCGEISSHYKATYDLPCMLPPSSWADRWPRLILRVSPDTGIRSRWSGLCTPRPPRFKTCV